MASLIFGFCGQRTKYWMQLIDWEHSSALSGWLYPGPPDLSFPSWKVWKLLILPIVPYHNVGWLKHLGLPSPLCLHISAGLSPFYHLTAHAAHDNTIVSM